MSGGWLVSNVLSSKLQSKLLGTSCSCSGWVVIFILGRK
ncbi:hypothetical protein EV682_102404 [Iodobacter fluviatilis]|uniref:Uncharacterized protein n=1 Tax=Iodobacter fluviatilis TaxID=537 RepID=A0A377Q7M4_9NEIS|nr:hypothetical protein EV682_102404 [Iodobacter fluviatilis]STQ90862.1 Uncharacterised protein [Iodobacter fluviatilis]